MPAPTLEHSLMLLLVLPSHSASLFPPLLTLLCPLLPPSFPLQRKDTKCSPQPQKAALGGLGVPPLWWGCSDTPLSCRAFRPQLTHAAPPCCSLSERGQGRGGGDTRI